MAVEWIISDGASVDPLLIAAKAEELLEEVVGCQAGLRFQAHGAPINVGDDLVESIDGLGGSDANGLLTWAAAESTASVEIEQDSYGDQEVACIGYVAAQRSKVSVALGVVVGVAWHSLSGGTFSGTGFAGRRYSGGGRWWRCKESLICAVAHKRWSYFPESWLRRLSIQRLKSISVAGVTQ